LNQENPDNLSTELQEMRQRIEQLERENERLRDKLGPSAGPDNPCFDARKFQRVMRRFRMMVMSPVMGMQLAIPALVILHLSHRLMGFTNLRIGPFRLFDFMGLGGGFPGMGFGIVAFGGVSVGIVACGGLSIGLIALGGGSIGVIAFGGGSVGIIAIGGGACGYIAIGGGAVGYYALGEKVAGKFALGINRQDPEAIEFFVPFVPGLRSAVTTPMQVILLPKKS